MRMQLRQRALMRLESAPEEYAQRLYEAGQRMRSPAPEDAARGVEGMLRAHGILRELGSVGVLIGSLAQAAWNPRETHETLGSYKDVDVMVLDSQRPGRFEGGIDWAIPRTRRLRWRERGAQASNDVTWWECGYGQTLRFGARREGQVPMEPGLYIPSLEWVARQRVNEMATKAAFSDDVAYLLASRTSHAHEANLLADPLTGPFYGRILEGRYGYPRGMDLEREIVPVRYGRAQFAAIARASAAKA